MPSNSPYVRRLVDPLLDELAQQLPAISLDGARGVGKTETAKRRATTIYELDNPAQAEIIRENPDILDTAPGPILLDEWQKVPEVWDRVRRLVDRGATPGRFLLTGSHPPTQSPTHSGAGRIVRVRMRPLSFVERLPSDQSVFLSDLLRGQANLVGETSVTLADYVEEILSSGFPHLRTYSGRARRESLDGYIDHALERDIPEQGVSSRRPDTLRAWLRAYAAATGSTASYQAILDAATPGLPNKPPRATTMAYRDALANLWLVDTVPPWLSPGREFATLSQTAKHYLADPAIAARLLQLDEEHLLRGAQVQTLGPQEGSILGRLFESLVAQSLHSYVDSLEATLSHVRDKPGRHEVDFIVEGPGGSMVAIEVKLSSRVDADDVKHLKWLRDKLGDRLTDAIVITVGKTAYRRSDGIGVVPFSCLGVDPGIPLGLADAS